jgi:thiamine monophosphate synthase
MFPAIAKRELDLSLYLVTGRDLLPHGQVTSRFISFLTHSPIRFIELFVFSRRGWPFTLSLSILPREMQALNGGVTVVQVREKNRDTAEVRCLTS